MEKQNSINGGEWLIRPTRAQDVFIPEDFDQEQILIRETCRDFIQQEVYPHLEAIDSMQDPTFMPTLLDKAGELGLLGVSVPEAYGGFGKDFNTGMLVAEETGAGHSSMCDWPTATQQDLPHYRRRNPPPARPWAW